MWDMGEIPMPGGWTLSSMWMPMCGQTWYGAAASFIAMWDLMMVAMMLPSILPVLWRMRPAPALVAAAGYFLVWTVIGAVVFAGGAAFAQAALQVQTVSRAVPVSMAAVVLAAGAFQLTGWKARHLVCCRPSSANASCAPTTAKAAWRYGVRLGQHCCRSCAGLTAVLLVAGIMDLRAMTLVAAVITAERLAPAGERIAWAAGAVSLVTGLYLMGRAAWWP